MCKAAQVLELPWFAYVADFVFDTVGQTGVKLVTKGGIAITLELRHEAVELHDVANDSLHVLHPQVVELVLSIVTTVTSQPSLVTPARVYSQSRPHPNTP